MTKINELPPLERPREKAFRYGIESLSNVELLAILIGSGTANKSAIDIAYELLNNAKGLYSLFNTPYQEFTKIKGLKKTKAVKLLATFELTKRYENSKIEEKTIVPNSEFVYQKVRPNLIGVTREFFILIMCNKNRRIIHEEILYKGVEDNVPFSLKDVLCTLLLHKASSFYIVHNHPNGILLPSISDTELTNQLMNETRKLSIRLIDHLIISENGYYSFLDGKSHTKE